MPLLTGFYLTLLLRSLGCESCALDGFTSDLSAALCYDMSDKSGKNLIFLGNPISSEIVCLLVYCSNCVLYLLLPQLLRFFAWRRFTFLAGGPLCPFM